ncbi:hypothetical protein ACFOPQ_03215 [Deinococcus antarcticus]|uniref:Uncharacterized protein n=1 Tax=Deinococcus antarcticus TaxID=1298767 RepID=A0ABV8A6I8_9DEIO
MTPAQRFPFPSLTGGLLLLLALGGLLSLVTRPPVNAVTPGTRATLQCTGPQRFQFITTTPENALQLNLRPLGATWRDLGTLQLLNCTNRPVVIHLSGHPASHWGALLQVRINDHTEQMLEITGKQSLTLPVTKNDTIQLTLLNYVRQAQKNYLAIEPLFGPWCKAHPPLREGAAWLQSSGKYGDITGEGQLKFTACTDGKATFKLTRMGNVSGQSGGAGTIRLVLRRNGRDIVNDELTGSRTIPVPLKQGDEVTIRAPGATNQMTAERYLELLGIETR